MAKATLQLVLALRKTAQSLRDGAGYRWSHFGQCNCGNLAQTITQLTPQQIQRAAFVRAGDWGEQAREYCPTSGLPMDYIVGKMLALGLEPEELGQLERLSHPAVLRRLEGRRLRHTERDDTILFLETWADLLAEQLPATAAERAA